jgi:K+ transporter
VDASFNLTQSKVNISSIFFIFFMHIYIYIWQLKCYVKLLRVWFCPTADNEGSGGICAVAYKFINV